MAMKRSIRIVIGNHHSYWGVDHIIEILSRDLFKDTDVSVTHFPSDQAVNIFIEEFSSKAYRELVVKCKGKKVLVSTEFITKQSNVYKINNFPSFTVEILRQIINSSDNPVSCARLIYLLAKDSFRKNVFITKTFKYWKSREEGLKEVLASANFDLIIGLHPKTIEVFESHWDTAVFYPTVRRVLKKRFLSNSKLITTGTLNLSRQAMLRQITRKLPISIAHFQMEDLENGNYSHENALVDVYLPNSVSWPYTSPIRIASSFSRNIPVVLYRNKDKHPITQICLQINDIVELSEIETMDLKNYFSMNIIEYNRFAKAENLRIMNKMKSLS